MTRQLDIRVCPIQWIYNQGNRINTQRQRKQSIAATAAVLEVDSDGKLLGKDEVRLPIVLVYFDFDTVNDRGMRTFRNVSVLRLDGRHANLRSQFTARTIPVKNSVMLRRRILFKNILHRPLLPRATHLRLRPRSATSSQNLAINPSILILFPLP